MTNDPRKDPRKDPGFVIRKVGPETVARIVELEDLVVAGLESDETFVPDGRKEILEDLARGAVIYGVFLGDDLVAYRYISFPKRSEANYGRDIGLEGPELDKVVNFTTTVVHPDWRGWHLQRRTMQQALSELKGTDYRHLLATISPLNYYSLKNMIRTGFAIMRIKRKYGKIADELDGKMRYILYRNIDSEVVRRYRKTITVNNTEIDLQKNLIRNGYVGYDVDELDEGEFKIFYGIPKA